MTNEGGPEENREGEREVQYGPALKNKKNLTRMDDRVRVHVVC